MISGYRKFLSVPMNEMALKLSTIELINYMYVDYLDFIWYLTGIDYIRSGLYLMNIELLYDNFQYILSIVVIT